ncbi:MAG: AsmA family protein [Nitrospirota bacterium]|nr:AsmA family protein [Nitrospirota bacterium]
MGKPLKITIIAIAIVLLIFVGVSVFVKSYLTDERMRTLVSGLAEESLNRKVSFGAIKISLFKGIVVRDFAVMEKDSEASFIKTKDFILRYQLLPLLSKRLVIDELSIVDPEIHIKKNPDGSFNFSDIAKSREIPEKEETEEGPAALPVSLSVKTIAVRNARVAYSDPAGTLKKADITLNAELGITGMSAKALKSDGDLEILLNEAFLKDRKQPVKDITTHITYKAEVDMASKKITVHSLDADVMNIPLNIQGNIGYEAEPALSLNMTVKDVNLSKVRDVSSMFLPAGMTLDGNVSLQLTVAKEPVRESPLSFNGRIRLDRVSFTRKGMHPVIDGTVKLTPELISLEDFRLLVAQNSADISASVRNYREYPDLNIAVKSRSLDLDELFIPGPSAEKPKEGTKAAVGGKEPEPMNLKMRVNASLDIDKTRYKGISITNFRSRCELKDNIFRVTNLSGNTLSGGFAFKATADLTKRGTQYNMNADLNGVKLEDVVNAFAPKAKDKLSGALYGKAEIAGAGTLPENIKRNLKGQGSFAVKDGVIKNAEVSTGLLTFLGLREMREIPMQKAEGSFTISDGIIQLISLIVSKDLVLDEKGTVGMDERLDIGLLVKVSERLTPKLVSQSSITRFLSEEKGWTSIPLRLGGTITKPSYSIDTRAVGRRATETLQKKIGEELFKSRSRDTKKPAGTEEKKDTTPEDLIKGLFGK